MSTTQANLDRDGRKRSPSLSLSTKILLALVLGIPVGLFFGEMVGFLKVVGDAFIKLLQMTVLPYVVISLVTGLGSLSYKNARILAVKGGGLLLILWAMALAMVIIFPLAFPADESGSFFSTALIQTAPKLDYLELFIPANPFHSLANNVVPAVVLFSAVVGIALIGVENKQGLMEILEVLNQALTRVTNFVVELTPIGVFAIAASAAGTMSIEQLDRLQVYMITYVVVALLSAFWILPGLVISFTQLRYRDVVSFTKDALITAFTTGSLFVVLPILMERSKEMLRKRQLETSQTEAMVDVIVPASFTFPHFGKVLSLSFVLFAAWFSGAHVSATDYPVFLLTGLVSFFGSITVALPFLLDMLRIPADTFQLFISTGVVLSRFGTLIAAMHTLVIALVGTCAITGMLQVSIVRVLRYGIVTVALVATTIGGIHFLFSNYLHVQINKGAVLEQMHLLHDEVPATVHSTLPAAMPSAEPGYSRLQWIRQRGYIRVGYIADNLPFAFFNEGDQLVGFDVEMAHRLAGDLGVGLELAPVERDRMAARLDGNYCDIIMSGIAITAQRALVMTFSKPYADETLAFIVPDYRRQDFNNREAVQNLEAPRIGIFDVPYYIAIVRDYLPKAETIMLGSVREYFEGRSEKLDAMVLTAQRGSAWTLIYPGFTAAIPHPDVMSVPLAYPMAQGSPELVGFINAWIDLKERQGTIDRLYDYWVLGKGAVAKKPRWSVIRDVLHWVE